MNKFIKYIPTILISLYICFTILVYPLYSSATVYNWGGGDYTGLSSDTKPTGATIKGGTRFYETDTKRIYIMPTTGGSWTLTTLSLPTGTGFLVQNNGTLNILSSLTYTNCLIGVDSTNTMDCYKNVMFSPLSLDSAVTTTLGGTEQNTSTWSAIPLVNSGIWGQYAGSSCSNGMVISEISPLGVATCVSVATGTGTYSQHVFNLSTGTTFTATNFDGTYIYHLRSAATHTLPDASSNYNIKFSNLVSGSSVTYNMSSTSTVNTLITGTTITTLTAGQGVVVILPGDFSISSSATGTYVWSSPYSIFIAGNTYTNDIVAFTYDIKIDFENSSDCSNAQLQATDNLASSLTYTLVGTSPNCNSSTAKKNGSYGMSKASGSNGYIGLTGINYSTISGGLWVYTPSIGNWQYTDIFRIENGATPIVVSFQRYGGTDSFLSSYISSGVTTTLPSTEASWYWISWKATSSGNLQMNIYDSTCSKIGGTHTESGINANNFTEVRWGYTSQNATTLYWDDVVLDWTNATFPLTPCP